MKLSWSHDNKALGTGLVDISALQECCREQRRGSGIRLEYQSRHLLLSYAGHKNGHFRPTFGISINA
jgi:hypothetical protein